MSRSEAQWGRQFELTKFAIPDDSFWSELEGYAKTDPETFATFRDGVQTALDWYQQRMESKNPETRPPTPRELRVAAAELLDAAEKLGRRLISGSGGLDYHLRGMMRFDGDPDPYSVGLDLLRIAGACRDMESWPEEKLVPLETLSDPFSENDPRKNLAADIAGLFISALRRKPTKTCNSDNGSRGPFAKVLSACLIQIDGREPADLKRLVLHGADKALGT